MVTHAADLELARACGEGDAAALRSFEERFMPAARRALGRFGGGSAFVADALQELRVRLFLGPHPRIRDYSGTGPLEGWLKITAVRVAINLSQRDHKHRPGAFDGGDDEQAVEELKDPELEFIKGSYREQVMRALRDAFAALSPTERSVLKLYLVDKLNIGEIGVIIGRSRATVGRLVITLRERLLDDTRVRLVDTLHIPRGEVDSVLRLVRSRLDFTLSKLLA
jgi:RNA polymerase sigma-70 factor (ECF subfamily)